MELKPQLIDVTIPAEAVGSVLVLHGGGNRQDSMAVSPTQMSVLRMVPIARRIARAGRGRLAVFRLLNARRGWNDSHTPVEDVSWALELLAERTGGPLPVCLVGHSLGGRAAILSAARPHVRSVAALAPWVYPRDVPSGLDGQRILIVHGDRDRVASPERSAALARALSHSAQVSYVTVAGGKHAMLRRGSRFEGLAEQFAMQTLLDEQPRGALARLTAGETTITV